MFLIFSTYTFFGKLGEIFPTIYNSIFLDPNQEVSRPAHDLFDAVFKDGRKNSSSESEQNDMTLLHTKKSPYFKYASKYWLRTLLYENIAQKPLDVKMQLKLNLLNDETEVRNRTRSRPELKNIPACKDKYLVLK